MRDRTLYILTVLLILLLLCIFVELAVPESVEPIAPAEEPVIKVERVESMPVVASVKVAPAPTEAEVEVPEPIEVEPEPLYTEEELEILALIVFQEGGGDAVSDECRQMIAEVFLNRVADERFPDTFYEVATQERQYGRLSWTGLQWPDRATNAGEAHAVQRAYDMAEALLAGSVERLLPEDVVFQAEFIQGEIVAELDGFYFCR